MDMLAVSGKAAGGGTGVRLATASRQILPCRARGRAVKMGVEECKMCYFLFFLYLCNLNQGVRSTLPSL